MTQELQILITTLSSSGIMTFIGVIFKRKITLEIESSIKNKYDSKIETLKSELNISQSILTSSLLNQTEGIKAVNEKRLKSIEKLWSDILECESLIQQIRFLDTITTINEFETINKNKDYFNPKFKETTDYLFQNLDTKRLVEYSDLSKNLEKDRPYIGEDLWLHKFYFDQFVSRIIYVYKSKYDNGENLVHWTKDIALSSSLRNFLSPEESKLIYEATMDSINIGINVFKQRILNKISEITSGTLVGKTSIENAISLSKVLNENK